MFSEAQWKYLKQTGTAKEWCEEQRMSYLEIECSSRWSSDWDKQQSAIIKTLEALQRDVEFPG